MDKPPLPSPLWLLLPGSAPTPGCYSPFQPPANVPTEVIPRPSPRAQSPGACLQCQTGAQHPLDRATPLHGVLWRGAGDGGGGGVPGAGGQVRVSTWPQRHCVSLQTLLGPSAGSFALSLCCCKVFGKLRKEDPGVSSCCSLGPHPPCPEQRAPSSPRPGSLPPPWVPARGCTEGFRAKLQLLQKQTPRDAFGEAAGGTSLPKVPAGNRLAGAAETG